MRQSPQSQPPGPASTQRCSSEPHAVQEQPKTSSRNNFRRLHSRRRPERPRLFHAKKRKSTRSWIFLRPRLHGIESQMLTFAGGGAGSGALLRRLLMRCPTRLHHWAHCAAKVGILWSSTLALLLFSPPCFLRSRDFGSCCSTHGAGFWFARCRSVLWASRPTGERWPNRAGSRAAGDTEAALAGISTRGCCPGIATSACRAGISIRGCTACSSFSDFSRSWIRLVRSAHRSAFSSRSRFKRPRERANSIHGPNSTTVAKSKT